MGVRVHTHTQDRRHSQGRRTRLRRRGKWGGFPLLSWQIWSEGPQPRVCQPPSKPRAETLPWPAAWAIRPHWGVRPHFKTRARERWEPGQSINTENTWTFTLDTHPNRWRERTQGRERRVDLHCGQSGDQCTCYNYKNKKPPKSWDESGVQMAMPTNTLEIQL